MDLDDPDPEPRICIALPEALVELALRGEWSDFVLLRRWHTHALERPLFPDWLPAHWRPDAVPQPPTVMCNFDQHAIGQLINTIHSWAPFFERAVVADPDPDEDVDMDSEHNMISGMTRVVTVLTSWQDALSGATATSVGKGSRMHSAAKLLKYLRASWYAGSTNRLDVVMKHSILAAMPMPVAAGLLKHLETKALHPSKWSLKRYRLALDLAFLLVSQEDMMP